MTEQANGLIDSTPFEDSRAVSQPTSINQNELITHAPFVDNAYGVSIRELPEDEKLSAGTSINLVRKRMEHEQYLDDGELDAVKKEISSYMDIVLLDDSTMDIQTKADIHGLLGMSLLYGKSNAERGSNDVHVESGNQIVIDPDRLDKDAADLLTRVGSEFINPSDARLAVHVHYIAHEQGHVLGSYMARELGLPPRSRALHDAYLSANPKDAYTGLAKTDPNIADERFAEGLAAMTTNAVFTNLGYSNETASKIVAAMGFYKNEYGAESVQQIDEVETARGLNKSVGEVALIKLLSKDENNEFNVNIISYEGGLGYAAPLGLQEIRDVLTFYSDNLRGGAVPVIENDPMLWRQKHDQATGGGMHPSLRARIERREDK